MPVAVQSRTRTRRTHESQLSPQTIRAEPAAEFDSLFQDRVRNDNVLQGQPRIDNLLAQRPGLGLPLLNETFRVALKCITPADNLDPLWNIGRGPYIDAEPEPVEKLRPEIALFRIAGTHQNETRGVTDTQPLPFDDIFP